MKTVRCSYDALQDPLRLTMLSGNWAQTVWDLQQNNVALNYAEGAQLSPARTVGKRAWEIGT